MKKMKYFFLLIVFFLLGCNTIIVDESNSNSKDSNNMITTTMDNYIYSNDLIEVKINRDNGSVSSFKNLKTKTDYITDSEGGNFSMLIDTSTANPFKTNQKSSATYLLSSRNFTPSIDLKKNDRKDIITMTYEMNLNETSIKIEGIKVISTLTFCDDFVLLTLQDLFYQE